MNRRLCARHCAWLPPAQIPADRPAASSERTGHLRRSADDESPVVVGKPFAEDRERTDRDDDEDAGIERLLRVAFQIDGSPLAIITPQSAEGGCTPSPRNEIAARSTIT